MLLVKSDLFRGAGSDRPASLRLLTSGLVLILLVAPVAVRGNPLGVGSSGVWLEHAHAIPSAPSLRLLGAIPVGTLPKGGALDPADDRLFVANYDSSNVSVISTQTDQVVASVTVGANPADPTYDPINREVMVPTDGALYAIDPKNADVLWSVPIGYSPERAAIDSASGDILITSLVNNSTTTGALDIVSPLTRTVVATVDLGVSPTLPVYDQTNDKAYVPVCGTGNLSEVDLSNYSITASIHVGGCPSPTVVGPGGGELFSTTETVAPGSLDVINPSTESISANVSVGPNSGPPAFITATGTIMVPCSGSSLTLPGQIWVVSNLTHTTLGTFTVGHGPTIAAFDNTSGVVYVLNTLSGSVEEFYASNDSLIASVNYSGIVNHLTRVPDSGRLYGADAFGNRVLVFGSLSSTSRPGQSNGLSTLFVDSVWIALAGLLAISGMAIYLRQRRLR